VEPGNFSISITRAEFGPLLSSAGELASVKLDAIKHAEQAVHESAGGMAELERQQAELAAVQDLVDQLARCARGGRARLSLSGRRALLEEIIHGALIAEAQELADTIIALEPTDELGAIAARVTLLGRLATTLARVRS
jgi:hypothetical protein